MFGMQQKTIKPTSNGGADTGAADSSKLKDRAQRAKEMLSKLDSTIHRAESRESQSRERESERRCGC